MKFRITFLLFLIAFAFVTVSPVFAKTPGRSNVGKPTATPTILTTPTPRATTAIQAQVRLNSARLQACKVHEKVLQTRLESLLGQAENTLNVFDKISLRVQDFYKTKVLAEGKSVENYDELLSEIQKKEAAVKTDLDIAKNDADAFVCDGIDPKGHLTQFRIDMQEVKKALKEYRTAIKNLIVAVRGVHAGETPTVTPTP